MVEWDGAMLSERVHEAMRIYTLAMNYNHSAGAQRGVSTRWHTSHAGFACRAALTTGDVLIGFGYGYTTKPGQWWHDLVRNAISPAASAWLDNAFELSEIHVLPRYQGRGIGRELLLSLAGGIGHERMLLSTPDRDTRAFRLYHNVGFVDLARNYLFPGDARPFAVLGASLPLTVTGS